MKRPGDLKRRRCPRGGTLSVQRRWDQPGWFVLCEACGTVAVGVAMAEARQRVEAHLAGADRQDAPRSPEPGTTS